MRSSASLDANDDSTTPGFQKSDRDEHSAKSRVPKDKHPFLETVTASLLGMDDPFKLLADDVCETLTFVQTPLHLHHQPRIFFSERFDVFFDVFRIDVRPGGANVPAFGDLLVVLRYVDNYLNFRCSIILIIPPPTHLPVPLADTKNFGSPLLQLSGSSPS